MCLAGRADAAEEGGGLCKPGGPSPMRETFIFIISGALARVALLLRFVYRDRTAHAQVRVFTFAFAFDEEIQRKSVYRFNLIHFQL